MPRHSSIQSAAPLPAKPRLLASSATSRSLPEFTKKSRWPMYHPARFLVVSVLLVTLGGCSDTTPTAPALGANPPRLSAIGKPTRTPLLAGPFEVPAGVACSFGVLGGEPIINNQVLTTFPPEPNGDIVQLATGALVFPLTNASTGKSITVNTSGPGRITIHPDGSTTLEAQGRWFLGLIENAPIALFISSGRVVISIAADGTPTLVNQSGHVEDVCALLS